MGENIGLEVKSASSCTTYHMVMGKRDAGSDALAKVILIYSETEISVLCFEVVDFVPTTRRWYDRRNPRDAGDWYACQSTNPNKGLPFWRPFALPKTT